MMFKKTKHPGEQKKQADKKTEERPQLISVTEQQLLAMEMSLGSCMFGIFPDGIWNLY